MTSIMLRVLWPAVYVSLACAFLTWGSSCCLTCTISPFNVLRFYNALFLVSLVLLAPIVSLAMTLWGGLSGIPSPPQHLASNDDQEFGRGTELKPTRWWDGIPHDHCHHNWCTLLNTTFIIQLPKVTYIIKVALVLTHPLAHYSLYMLLCGGMDTTPVAVPTQSSKTTKYTTWIKITNWEQHKHYYPLHTTTECKSSPRLWH